MEERVEEEAMDVRNSDLIGRRCCGTNACLLDNGMDVRKQASLYGL